MSDISIFNEKTSNINNGKDIVARIVDFKKIEDIPEDVLPNNDRLSSFEVWCEKHPTETLTGNFLNVDDQNLEIVFFQEMTFRQDVITYLLITKRG